MIKFVSETTAPLFEAQSGTKEKVTLLWGDRVRVISQTGARWQVRARGKEGFVDPAALGDESLLEVYFIDVGQGDGVLIRTPDGRHALIDGGFKRSMQPSGKNAADFVDWKFFEDYEMDHIQLDALIASHCDADHFGGLYDLINPLETHELDLTDVRVKRFGHAGVSYWTTGQGEPNLGPKQDGFLTKLLGDRASLTQALDTNAPLHIPPTKDWGKFLKLVHGLGCPVDRLGHQPGQPFQFVTGFGPNDGPGTLKVLGPVEFIQNGQPVVRSLGGVSQNTNGNSVLLRLDYGRTRILLTGDLNASSQKVLLDAFTGQRQEFACDVGKACHHGSDDCSFEFLSAMSAAATVISSGDSEGHAHPRPAIVAASALTGHTRIEADRVVTPLVYSTEIARSVRLGRFEKLIVGPTGAGNIPPGAEVLAEHDATMQYKEVASGSLSGKRDTKKVSDKLHVVAGLVYGLVNVRTDGNTILCATMHEDRKGWDVRTFESRF